jgi:4-hydroxybenzoate polyprenyltransferase
MKYYIAIARPNHWFKNIFMFPGVIVAAALTQAPVMEYFTPLILGIISICLLTSANYTINEWVDAEFDRHHPIKKDRPSVLGHIHLRYVIFQYIILVTGGLIIGSLISNKFFLTGIFLLFMGVVYNIQPIRAKDKPYIDVLTESINNPIRMFLGWFVVTSSVLPPSSLVMSYWMGGAFLMAVKRYAELRLITDRSTAILYRRSFLYYTENNLLLSILFYAMMFAFFFGIFMIKYRIELLLSLPFFAILFVWYLKIGMLPNSPAQRPEKLYSEKGFLIFIIFIVVLVTILFSLEWKPLHWFLNTVFLGSQ